MSRTKRNKSEGQSISSYIAKSWKDNWTNLIIFWNIPKKSEEKDYTTNPIAPLNTQLRKTSKTRRFSQTTIQFSRFFTWQFKTLKKMNKHLTIRIRCLFISLSNLRGGSKSLNW